MDIALARTFLAIVQTGNFMLAGERLHVTQTAVSARVRSLENMLGRRLFVRNKAGARLTPAGERFQRDALTLVQVWERARHRVALPRGYAHSVGIGGELSLWSPLLANWLVWMRQKRSKIALRAEVDAPAQLLAKVQSGSLDLAVLYSPLPQHDLTVELLIDDKLVLVTTSDGGQMKPGDYIHVDWGPAFSANEQAAFPQLANAAVSISLGPLALAYLLEVGGSGYFRQSAVAPYLASQRLRHVRDAPAFAYSIHAVYSGQAEAAVIDEARAGLHASLALPNISVDRVRHRSPPSSRRRQA